MKVAFKKPQLVGERYYAAKEQTDKLDPEQVTRLLAAGIIEPVKALPVVETATAPAAPDNAAVPTAK